MPVIRGITRRAGAGRRGLVAAALVAVVALLVVPLSASATGAQAGGTKATGRSAGPPPVPRHAGKFGIVPSGFAGHAKPQRPTPGEFAHNRKTAGGSNLVYHNGPVMHTNQTYTIYWSPGGIIPTGYESVIDRFFTDVGAASNTTGNVYSSDTQYYDTTGAIQYSSTFEHSWVDTKTPIPDHCSNEYRHTGATVSGCVLDSDIQAEISRALKANTGWTAGPSSMFFVFTPRNVGSCFDSSSGMCSYTYYCAYHSDFTTSSGQEVLYANQPYTDTSGVFSNGTQVCSVGQFPNPNGGFADATINVASHEHNEAITDPLGTAWYDSQGYENGDKCAWNFGTPLGITNGSYYNQVINGDKYYLQQEWSNASSSCVLQYGPPAPPAPPPSISSFSPTEGPATTTVTVTGSGFTGAKAVSFNGAAATSFTVDSDTKLTATVPDGATTGPISVTTGNGTGTGGTFIVDPAVTGFSPSSGTTGTTVTISGSGLNGVTSVTFAGVTASFSVGSGGTTITATVPTAAVTGSLVVATPNKKVTAGTFTVDPSITGFTPTTAPVGTGVTISGSGFSSVSSVSFNGVGASYNVNYSSTSITATVPTGVTSGPITVTTAAGTATSTGSFTVGTATAPDFTITVSPGSRSVSRGKSTTYTVTVSPNSSFTSVVTLSASGLPNGAHASFSPGQLTTGGSTLTVKTKHNVHSGTYQLTITGSGGGLSHSVTVTLAVN